VTIQLEGNFVYPPTEGVLLLSLSTVNAVLLIMMMGIFLVPSLLVEEKETRTMQALLVSPASISQVVMGKTLAGWFYIVVTGAVIFAISWAEVTHWEMAVLFVMAGGFFSVAVGLVLGSVFDKHQDMVGWMMALLLILVGTILVKSLGVELPALFRSLLPWIPSVALAEILRAAFSQTVDLTQVLTSLGIIIAISLPLYAFVIWKIRRSDR
jgi:ABC-2 type transport system permease protein